MRALVLEGRARTRERMETERVGQEEFTGCLADMERLILLCRGYRPTLDWLGRIAVGRRSLSVLDVGCGGGEMLRRIATWASEQELAIKLTGLDRDPAAIAAAQQATESGPHTRYILGDLRDLPDVSFDVIVSAHVAHHLEDSELLGFLCWMERAARLGWFVNDLHRHAIPYWSLRFGLPLGGFHRFVRSDGPLSVRRAFVRSDWQRALAAAGIDPERVEITWHWPFRWGVGTHPNRPR
jgi:2-polyprenyl-3-methyl-5-hydroxy-6-metoxy-1,4-benzoquinol methylase